MRYQFSFGFGCAFQWAEMALALLVAVPSLAGQVPAPECAFFRGARIISVGGHEAGTPAIPVAIDQLTIDVAQHQACHALRWSIYTVKAVSPEKVCFDISEGAKDQKVALSARFPTGATARVAELSAFADRAIAKDLAQACRGRSVVPQRPATPGVDL